MSRPSPERAPRSLSRLERILFAALLLLLAWLGIVSDGLRRIDNVLYDSFLHGLQEPLDSQLAIVAVDEASLNALGQWPWRRSTHAQLLQALKADGASAVLFDMLFTEADRNHPEDDRVLAQAIHDFGKVVLPVHFDQRSPEAPLSEIMPLPGLVKAAAELGHAHVELDRDGIARGLYLYQGVGDAHWPAISLALLQQVAPQRAQPYVAVHQYQQANETEAPYPWFNVREDYYQIPFVGTRGSVPTYSYADVLQHRIAPDLLRGKLIFVGATAAGLGDVLPTPFSGLQAPMPGVEVHANAFNALYQQNLIQTLPRGWQYLLTLALALLPALWFPRISPDRNLPLTLALLLLTLGGSYLLLVLSHRWFAPASALTVLFLAYPLWSWRRLSRLTRFLNQELQRLSREPTLVAPQEGAAAVSNWFQQLVKLLEPDQFVLYLNHSLLHQSATGEAAQIASNLRLRLDFPERQWQWLDGAWWLRFGDRQQRYLARLGWQQDDAATEARQHTLAALLPPITRSLPSVSLKPTELLERRIEQVQTAIGAMRTMRQFISDSFEHMPDAILVTDRLGRILFANAHCYVWFGRSASDSLNHSLADWLEAFPNQDHQPWLQLIRQVLVQGQVASANLRLPDRELLAQMVPFAATDSHDSGLIVSFADITRLREEQRRRLETIDFVSHDLRAPLVSQMALLDQFSRDPGITREDMVKRARLYTEKSLELADQFLQLTRVEATEDIRFYECELLAILENAIDQVQQQAQRKQISIRVDDDAEEAWISGNAELLERMLVNLLTNAIKFSPTDSLIHTHVRVQAPWVEISVADQGCGMSAAEIPLIFERFQRLPGAEHQRVAGVGLGLRFVKVVVDRHQGTIEVDSTPNEGTCFTLRLPLPAEERVDAD